MSKVLTDDELEKLLGRVQAAITKEIEGLDIAYHLTMAAPAVDGNAYFFGGTNIVGKEPQKEFLRDCIQAIDEPDLQEVDADQPFPPMGTTNGKPH